MELQNIKKDDPQYNLLLDIVETLVSSPEGNYIDEIFLKEDSFRQGMLGNWFALMLEVDKSCPYLFLHNTINNLDEKLAKCESKIVISSEPNWIDRSRAHKIIYKKNI